MRFYGCGKGSKTALDLSAGHHLAMINGKGVSMNEVSPGGLISLARWKLRLSSDRLATILGVGYNKVILWEAGKGEPTEAIVKRLEELVASGYRGR